jgi:hypothetical protein
MASPVATCRGPGGGSYRIIQQGCASQAREIADDLSLGPLSKLLWTRIIPLRRIGVSRTGE